MQPTTTLALDCSFAGLHIILQNQRDAQTFTFADTTPRSSDILHTQLAQLFEKSGTTAANLRRIAVTTGPGSFTGIRIALATAQAFKVLNNQIEITGFSTLQALALDVLQTHQPSQPFAILLNAAGQDIYLQTFDAHANPTTPATCQPQPAALASIPANVLIAAQSNLLLPASPAFTITGLNPTILLEMLQNPAFHLPPQPAYLKELTYRHAT